MDKIPLNYEASEGDTHKRITTTLPQEVVQCLENARFLHLATCVDNVPNVSLMNYTYLPSSPFTTRPTIILTTNPASRKTSNILTNPNVSLLVHDWVSHRPPTQARRPSGGSPPPQSRSSLAAMLQNLNSSAMSSISATIGGIASLAASGSEEEKHYLEQHLENNTFEEENGLFRQNTTTTSNRPAAEGEQAGHFVAGEEVRVIVVDIRDVRISDWKGTVRDWAVVEEGQMVNGNSSHA